MAEVTSVKLFLVKNHKTVKANGFLVLDGEFSVKFSLMQGSNGLFVSFPADKYEKDGETKYSRHFEPTGEKDVRYAAQKKLNDAVITVFKRQTGAQQPSSEPENQVPPDNNNLVPF